MFSRLCWSYRFVSKIVAVKSWTVFSSGLLRVVSQGLPRAQDDADDIAGEYVQKENSVSLYPNLVNLLPENLRLVFFAFARHPGAPICHAICLTHDHCTMQKNERPAHLDVSVKFTSVRDEGCRALNRADSKRHPLKQHLLKQHPMDCIVWRVQTLKYKGYETAMQITLLLSDSKRRQISCPMHLFSSAAIWHCPIPMFSTEVYP